jgi:hypothetical protein
MKRVKTAFSLLVFMDRMSKLNKSQDILYFCVHFLSNVLAVFLRPTFAVLCCLICVSLFVITSSIDRLMVIDLDPIFSAGLFSGLVFITLLLVSYWFVMANINPARQKLAFSLPRADVLKERRYCVRCVTRCRAPFFRFR